MRLLTWVVLLVSGVEAQDLGELVRKAIVASKANGEKSNQYAYREYKVTVDLDKNGKESNRKTETWDVIGLEGSSYRKLVLEDDKPLPPKQQKKEDERLAKETALRKKETPEQRRKRLFSFSYSVGFKLEQMPVLYDLGYGGEEVVSGRPAHLVVGTPKAGLRPSNANDKELLHYRAKVWLDKEDGVLSKFELEVIAEGSRMEKGTNWGMLLERDQEGVWLAKTFHLRYSLRVMKAWGGRGNVETAFSDYKRFQVDSRIVEDGK